MLSETGLCVDCYDGIVQQSASNPYLQRYKERHPDGLRAINQRYYRGHKTDILRKQRDRRRLRSMQKQNLPIYTQTIGESPKQVRWDCKKEKRHMFNMVEALMSKNFEVVCPGCGALVKVQEPD